MIFELSFKECIYWVLLERIGGDGFERLYGKVLKLCLVLWMLFYLYYIVIEEFLSIEVIGLDFYLVKIILLRIRMVDCLIYVRI